MEETSDEVKPTTSSQTIAIWILLNLYNMFNSYRLQDLIKAELKAGRQARYPCEISCICRDFLGADSGASSPLGAKPSQPFNSGVWTRETLFEAVILIIYRLGRVQVL